MNGTKRGKPKNQQPALFDTTPVAKPAKLPYRILRELVDKYGLQESSVKAMPVNVAFARYYQFRDGKAITPERRAEIMRELAEKLRIGSGNRSWSNRELVDALTEVASSMDRTFLDRVCAGLSAAITKEYPAPVDPAAKPF